MKRIVFSLLTICFASLVTFAQQISLGIKPSFIILESKYFENPNITGLNLSSRSSYAVGFTGKMNLSKLLSIQIEPRFIEKGYNIKLGEGDYDIYKNGYISLPTLLCITPIHNLNIELGPEFAYLVSSKEKYNTGSFQDYKSQDQNHFELSLITGISYSFLKRFDLGIRYGIGLTPYENGEVAKADFAPPEPKVNYKIYNRYFEFFLNTRIFTIIKNK
jgi:Outer membrane protein beta-barrel domain